MAFVIFLDIDGVLNTRTTCERATSEQYTGIDGERVKILGLAMKECRAEGVVLTTDWKDLPEEHEDYVYLQKKLAGYGIKILGKTQEPYTWQRGVGILQYLQEHPEIEEYVIIDDQHFDFRDDSKLWENYLDTECRGIEHSILASKTPTVTAMVFLDSIKHYSL